MTNTERKPSYRVNSYKLNRHQYAQCHVENMVSNYTDEIDAIQFISYNTLVIEVRPYCGNAYIGRYLYTVECTGTYSQTTRKQIGWFLNEYLPGISYSNMKAIAGTRERLVVGPVTNTPIAQWRVLGRE